MLVKSSFIPRAKAFFWKGFTDENFNVNYKGFCHSLSLSRRVGLKAKCLTQLKNFTALRGCQIKQFCIGNKTFLLCVLINYPKKRIFLFLYIFLLRELFFLFDGLRRGWVRMKGRKVLLFCYAKSLMIFSFSDLWFVMPFAGRGSGEKRINEREREEWWWLKFSLILTNHVSHFSSPHVSLDGNFSGISLQMAISDEICYWRGNKEWNHEGDFYANIAWNGQRQLSPSTQSNIS